MGYCLTMVKSRKYRDLAARFTTENNDFQRREEKSGRHQIVKKMIEEYQIQTGRNSK